MVLLLIVGISVPFMLSAQTGTTPEWQKKAVDWAQGGNIFEDWFMKEFLTQWKAIVWSEFGTFINMAKVIAGLMTLLHFASKAYEMMADGKKLEIMPLLRPFGLCMIIIYWGSFIEIVSFPTNLIAQATAAKQEAQQKKVNNLRYVRAEYQYAFVNALYDSAAETEVAADQSKSFLEDPLGTMGRAIKNSVSSVVSDVIALKTKLEIGLQLALTQGLELTALWILRVAVYTLFAIQIIYTGILIMLGPFSVALSVIPMFKDSFATWIARFISVNLYLGIAFIIMFVGGVLQEFAMQSEINKYAELVTKTGNIVSMEKLLYLKSNGIMSFGVVIVSFLLSAITMFTVPSISTWIVSTSGATSAVSTMGRAGSMITRGMTRGLLK